MMQKVVVLKPECPDRVCVFAGRCTYMAFGRAYTPDPTPPNNSAAHSTNRTVQYRIRSSSQESRFARESRDLQVCERSNRR